MIESLGHYRILDRIGAGGLGDLYRARDTRLGRTVALRVLAPAIAGDPERLASFLRDARTAAAVSHPNIAAIYEVAEDGGVYFLATEFVTGQKLKGLIAGRPLNPRRAIDLTVQMADAVADAHANEVVHGDLRADAILVNAKGNAKLLDFGLTQWTSAARTDPAVDHQTDIAALGAILHEMLTGRPPDGSTPPSQIDDHLPAELDPIVQRSRSAYLNEQYQAAATLAAELRSVAAILDVRAKAASEIAVAPPRSARRREAIVWITAVTLIGLLAWLVWTASKMR